MAKLMPLFMMYLFLLLAMTSPANADVAKGDACLESEDYDCALKEFKAAADQGDAGAQHSLGHMYREGKGVKQDYYAAVKWYRLAADQGYVYGQLFLGGMYFKGLGVRQDKRIAKEWLGKACDGGMQLGCDKYRELNEEGY